MEQRIAVLVSAVLCIILLGIFAAIARSASTPGSAEEVAASATRWRKTTFWGLLIVFVPTIAWSLTLTPYGADLRTPAAVVEATGTQWAWELSRDTVPAGVLVEIRVTGRDVNHGLGVYDLNNRLVTQTQAMPGYTNVIRHVFPAPGTYRLLCLEYCGLGHHTMAKTLVVTDSK